MNNPNGNQYPPQPGQPPQGAPQQGYPPAGAQPGYPPQGAPQQGYPPAGAQPGYGQMPQQPAPGQAPQQSMGADALRGLFGGLAGADVGGDARFPNVETPGLYNGVVESVKVVTSKTDRSKNFLICEYKLVNSSSTLHPEGQMYSWVHNLSNQFYGLPNAKAWMAAVLGFGAKSAEAAALNENDMVRIVTAPDAIKGRPFSFRCRMHTTKQINQNTGRPNEVPVLDFFPFDQQAPVPTPQAPPMAAAPPQHAPPQGQQQGYPPQGQPAPQQGYPPQGQPAPQQGYPPQGQPGYPGGN